ncbi:hypothetical protein ACQQ2Q_01835 [Agrobacterium sp. ES01]|uniref:hypothetical protein n=1 Tax=Agrobacterium sp. ES01 TaxID=3420714 RepID=UPI003D0B8C02
MRGIAGAALSSARVEWASPVAASFPSDDAFKISDFSAAREAKSVTIADGSNDIDGRSQNRRVEIKLE